MAHGVYSLYMCMDIISLLLPRSLIVFGGSFVVLVSSPVCLLMYVVLCMYLPGESGSGSADGGGLRGEG